MLRLNDALLATRRDARQRCSRAPLCSSFKRVLFPTREVVHTGRSRRSNTPNRVSSRSHTNLSLRDQGAPYACMAEVSLEQSLYCCCRDGLLSDALLLIAKGANVNWPNALENDATPVYVASYNGHDQVVLALAHAGADVDACNRAGMFSLFIAAQCVRHLSEISFVYNSDSTGMIMSHAFRLWSYLAQTSMPAHQHQAARLQSSLHHTLDTLPASKCCCRLALTPVLEAAAQSVRAIAGF